MLPTSLGIEFEFVLSYKISEVGHIFKRLFINFSSDFCQHSEL